MRSSALTIAATLRRGWRQAGSVGGGLQLFADEVCAIVEAATAEDPTG